MKPVSRVMARRSALLPLGFAVTVCSGAAFAQAALERNLPEQVLPPAASFTVGDADYGEADGTPFGVDLAGVRLIGQDETVRASQGGISIGSVPGAAQEPVRQALTSFLGQPLSRELIVRIQSALAGVWRAQGFPFVSITVPPQEVTSGVLTLRVIEFSAGAVRVESPGAIERNLGGQVRIVSGDRIDARALEEDLDWLNRNPFRRIESIFAPGDETGASDITLKVTRDKPFSVFGSWSNTGSEDTGRDRWSIGGGFWAPMLNDLTASYRFTRSGEFWNGANLFELDMGQKGYLSHAGRVDLPTLPRQALSIAPNYVETNEFAENTPFSFHNRTLELPIFYSGAISNILPGRYWGDVYFGIEPKWVRRTTYFDETEVAEGRAGLFNIVLGWSGNFSDAQGRTVIDARIKANAPGVLDDNDDASWGAFTGGRVTDVSYVHAGIDITRLTALPRNFSWASRLSGLIAGQALPDTERLGLGGFYAVRGYDNDDGAVDTGFVWRNEIRMPTLSPLANAASGLDDSLSPFAFLDLGHGYDFGSGDHVTLSSGGFGFDYQIGKFLSANFTAAVALSHGSQTSTGDWMLNAGIRIAY